MTPKEIIAVLQAYEEGKTVQFRPKGYKNPAPWADMHPSRSVGWDFVYHEWRVKPEPREWWINKYHDSCPCFHYSKQDADDDAMKHRIECIHVREVLE